MKAFVKKMLNKLGYEIRHRTVYSCIGESVTLEPEGEVQGAVLLAYILEPFLSDDKALLDRHTHHWESMQIAKTYLEFGYSVDIIDYRDREFVPTKKYDIFVSARTNFERLAKELGPNCTKVVHLDTAHWLFNNNAALSRCLDLKHRRGVATESFRRIETNWALEHADCATILGNQFTIDTYAYAEKAIHRIPISTCSTFPWNAHKNYDAVRKNYLWLGSKGLVHKGLDLLLEVFSRLPDYHLYICGPVIEPHLKKIDRPVVDSYHRELFNTGNIHTLGWCNVNSRSFKDLADQCLAIIFPSASEGGGGCVLNCMHAGLIPIVSYEASIDVSDYGILLKDCSLETIKKAVLDLSSMTGVQLRTMSRKSWEFVNANHTRERFASVYHEFVANLISS